MLRLAAHPAGLAGLLAIPFALSMIAARLADLRIDAPGSLLLSIALVAVPYAFCVLRLLLFVNDRIPQHRLLTAAVGTTIGIGALWYLPHLGTAPALWILSAGVLLTIDFRRLPTDFFGTVLYSVLALSITLAMVCNLNYLLAAQPTLLHDPLLTRMDTAFYGWLFSGPVTYDGLFPLIDSTVGFRLLENAYQMLFAEIAFVLLAIPWLGRDVGPFLRATVLCYLGGVIAFFFYPAVGPSIYHADAIATGLQGTQTLALMERMTLEFAAASQGYTGNGFAYFIAVPSLHVALAVLCQFFVAGSRPLLFWTLLPINALIVASTVVLGFHYVVDVPAGALLAMAAFHVVTKHDLASSVLSRAWHRIPRLGEGY